MEKDILRQLIHSIDFREAGIRMHQLMKELYPICRSITGDGERKTLRIIKNEVPLEISEVPTGKKVFDWTIPKEWNINDAYIKDSMGNKIIDFNDSNLHVLNYSIPIHKNVSLDELKKHLFTIPENPEWIPYRTSYYEENWGFCMSHNQLKTLKDETYEVLVDSTLKDGHLTYGELYIKGRTSDEVLISTHICHPSLCNDNLSGIALSCLLAKMLSQNSMRYSYRFLFIPGTIGSITWLALNEGKIKNIKHGLVVVCVGDSGNFTFKKSRQGDAEIDQIVEYFLKTSGKRYAIIDFFPYGYDERQYCSPGFDLPVGCLMRTPHGEYPEYHTSADNLQLVSPENLAESLNVYLKVIGIIECNTKYSNLNPKCEPQLGRRGLYDAVGGSEHRKQLQMAMLWNLNLADKKNDLLQVAKKSKLPFDVVREAAVILEKHNLLKEIE